MSTTIDDPAANARRWLLTHSAGTLCTLSARAELEGHPYGSVVPFALTARGEPLLLLATIAAHTANLVRDDRASLLVRQPDVSGDPQRGWRITLMGRAVRLTSPGRVPKTSTPADVQVSDAEIEEVHARYLERVPATEDYMRTHGFWYWRLQDVQKVRYIGGFGKIHWLDGDALLRDPAGEGLQTASPGAIEHMNDDHANNMVEMCHGLMGFHPEQARMVGLDRTGFLVRTQGPDRLVHFSFEREIAAPDLRHAVVDVLKRARAAAPLQ
ncbi:MAG: DUF2470 domain-containing protein [Myxococcales bacterium]|nr:DUF2470 domain-containing protein [Myxococcales bacterium]